MTRRVAALVAAVGALALALPARGAAGAMPQQAFPHERHEGLFPTCTGCHGGIATGDASRFYPGATACTACHDGERRRRVETPEPGLRPSNLDFTHPSHDRAVRDAGGTRPGCARCHAREGSGGRMAVGRARPDACLACHAHEAPSHLAEGRDCAPCHRALTDAPDLSPERIRRFRAPAAHARADFVSDHAPPAGSARCATCHARESCTRCHMNGASLPAVQALRPDPRVAALEGSRPPFYPQPGSHRSGEWTWEHGGVALDRTGGCANCHARESCASCHREGGVAAVAALPTATAGDPRGVRIEERGLLHPPGYDVHHGAAAASDDSCSSCHRTSFCESCHAGSTSPAFHFPDYLERHGPEAYSAATDCGTCHDQEVFCRACHEGVGLGDRRRAGVTLHTSRPFWLVGHGTAARQGLSGCVTCHDQADCATCHSARFGWRVNPHGPGFDPVRARDANPFSCARCHAGGGAP